MVFYSLVFPFNPDHDDEDFQVHHHRQLIVAPNRAVADIFFRALQDLAQAGSFFEERNRIDSVHRISPQMWTYSNNDSDSLRNNILRAILSINIRSRKSHIPSELREQIRGKLTIEYVADWDKGYIPVLPDLDVADHITDHPFTIRNKEIPDMNWAVYFHDEDKISYIYASTRFRSKFRIRRIGKENDKPYKGQLMIGSDNVEIDYIRPQPDEHGNMICDPVILDYEDYKLKVKKGGGRAQPSFGFNSFSEGNFLLQPSSDKNDNGPYVTYDEHKFEAGQVWELC